MKKNDDRMKKMLDEMSPEAVSRLHTVVTRDRTAKSLAGQPPDRTDEETLWLAMGGLQPAERRAVLDATRAGSDAVIDVLSVAPALPLLAIIESSFRDAATAWNMVADFSEQLGVMAEALQSLAVDDSAEEAEPALESMAKTAATLPPMVAFVRTKAATLLEGAEGAAAARKTLTDRLRKVRAEAAAQVGGVDPLPPSLAAFLDDETPVQSFAAIFGEQLGDPA